MPEGCARCISEISAHFLMARTQELCHIWAQLIAMAQKASAERAPCLEVSRLGLSVSPPIRRGSGGSQADAWTQPLPWNYPDGGNACWRPCPSSLMLCYLPTCLGILAGSKTTTYASASSSLCVFSPPLKRGHFIRFYNFKSREQ